MFGVDFVLRMIISCYQKTNVVFVWFIEGAKMKIKDIFKDWKSPCMTRDQLYKVTGGLIHPKTIRNLDSLGKGIDGKFFIGRKVAYPTEEVIKYLEKRLHFNFNEVTHENDEN